MATNPHVIPVPTILNVVSNLRLGCALDAQEVAERLCNAMKKNDAAYYHDFFTEMTILRLSESEAAGTTATCFDSGMLACTGAKTVDQSIAATMMYARLIKSLDFPVNCQEEDIQIRSIVASCDVKFHIRLDDFAELTGGSSIYNPRLYPPLIYRMTNPSVVLLISEGGKIILIGARVIHFFLSPLN
ncbi:PREDICTED: TATA-box-binding protein 2-like [Ipomoea nil]|uniref:TATA-box-binding protein 2-like n=1 Tax=Ipomoea nil TaxID=35883 RepID=UPI0009009ED1|nr:PREDICTED: TATA-box-binding protein 2-like [Ipomoea nil]